MISWDEVEVGHVLEDITSKEMFIVTETYVRMDDPAHPFHVIRLFCLTNDDLQGMTMMTGSKRSSDDWDTVWKPE